MTEYFHSDQDCPLGSISTLRNFSKLCYWLIDLDSVPVFSNSGCPSKMEDMKESLKI